MHPYEIERLDSVRFKYEYLGQVAVGHSCIYGFVNLQQQFIY